MTGATAETHTATDTLLPPVTIAAMMAALYCIFVAVPTDSFQGPVQRIFYVHMSMWLATFSAFGLVALASLMYLWRREPEWDRRGRAAAELRPRESLTRDHVVPLSRGGTNAWTNVVTACSICNTKKAHHLPDEIGLHLIRPPTEPHFVHLSWAVRRLTPTQGKYIRLFYGPEVLAQIEALEHRGHAHPNRVRHA